MPTVNPPRLQSYLAKLPKELAEPLSQAMSVQDKHAQDLATALNKALVLGDTLQVSQPYTATSPLVVPSDWVVIGATGAPAFQGTWSNPVGGNAVASYHKSADGWVTIRGLITGGTINTTAFTLPTGFRPSLNETFSCSANGAFGNLVVKFSDGTVVPQVGSGTLFSMVARFQCSDASPYVPSCFPFSVSWPKAYAPTLVLAQAQDVTTPSSPSNLAMAVADWTLTTSSAQSFISIRNMPGLLPGKNYAVQVIAF